MAVYIVTGKLGAGKTLLLIIRILTYLKARRRVAVNVDVNMNKLCKPGNKYSRLVRLPDLPSADDLIGLGVGCDIYDEEKFGGIFLDEAGVWLNSRDWNQGGRSDLLKFFLFLRKRRWDLWLCVQNVNVIDKQVRESIAEHVVYINRWDKLKIPFIFRLPLQILSFGMWKGRLPKMHQAIVKYGAKFNSPKVEDWFYRGEEYYSYYDTTQEYDKGYDKGSYSMLPPGYWRRVLPAAKRNMGFYMRTTKIFFRRTSVINSFFLGGACALFLSVPIFGAIAASYKPASVSSSAPAPKKSTNKLEDDYGQYRVATYGRLAGHVVYIFRDGDGNRVSADDLSVKGITVKDRGPREALLVRDEEYISVYR
ncbi:zonular occludens toxin domain-containing protein [Pseudomonas solani]|uniref:zonular occludens toxin domain-containing protein n=1 Tax=Pseudomonas solani TaxID=2731552 RepID=UPI003D6A8BD7